MKKLIMSSVLMILIQCEYISIKSDRIVSDYYDVYHEGDSITSFMSSKYLQYKAINMAQAGSRIDDVYKRVTEADFAVHPDFIIIMIGINNLFSYSFDIDEYKKLINLLHSRYNESRIVCVSILPVDIKGMNELIIQANSEIESFSKEAGYIYLYVYRDMLPPEYRIDGVHLSDAGYKKLTSFYNRIVKNQDSISR